MKLKTTGVWTILLLLCGAADVLSVGMKERRSVYRNEQQGIEFNFPASWAHEKCDEAVGTGECLGFRKKVRGKRQPAPDYLMTVMLKNTALDQAVADDILFEKVEGGWVKHGRFSTVKARKISANGLQGIYAVADCGISDEQGFHAAGGECLTAFLSDGSRTVIIETDGTTPPAMVLSQVVRSVKLIAQNQPASNDR